MSEGLIYEPRSLWSIGYTTRTGNDPGARIRLPRRHFHNGGRRPITLERMAIAAINYPTREMAEGNQPAAAAPLPFYGSSVINRVGVTISAPFRQHYAGSQTFTVGAIAPLPTAQPPMLDPSATDTNHRSSLWGINALNFDYPLYVPRNGVIQWDVSALPLCSQDGEATPAGNVNAYMLFQEAGGLFAGNTRGDGWGYVPQLASAAMPVGQLDEHFPFARDPVSNIVGLPVTPVANIKGTDTTADPWRTADTTATAFGDKDNVQVTDDVFLSQAKNRDGSSKVTGMRIMYDQINYDAGLQAIFADDPKEPVASRIGTRVRSRSGSGEWWWRPGAPVALVLDTITSALVYKLPAPITVGPGDTLDVEMTFPGFTGAQIEEDVSFQVGVALNGFAAIEG